MTVAALYVDAKGPYMTDPRVDPWPESRDARRYAGPWPVVAHPPCNLWVNFAAVNWKRYGRRLPAWYPGGSDGGCFARHSNTRTISQIEMRKSAGSKTPRARKLDRAKARDRNERGGGIENCQISGSKTVKPRDRNERSVGIELALVPFSDHICYS